MPMNIQRALTLGQFVNAAENPTAANPLTYAIPFGFQLVQAIYGNDLATDIGGPKDIVPFGFIAKSPAPANDFVVAIRGTASIWEWIQDARFLRVACPCAKGAGESEDGFTGVYQSLVVASTGGIPRVVDVLRGILGPLANATLAITGHSLGAALATLLALEVTESGAFATPEVITFASPLVGDPQFARTYNTEVPNTWRLANELDLVPKMPPSVWGYDHADQLSSLNSFLKVKMEPACCHHLTTYLHLLNLLSPGGNFPLDGNCGPGL
jgi:triacylglycerol lipase